MANNQKRWLTVAESLGDHPGRYGSFFGDDHEFSVRMALRTVFGAFIGLLVATVIMLWCSRTPVINPIAAIRANSPALMEPVVCCVGAVLSLFFFYWCAIRTGRVLLDNRYSRS